MKKQLSMPTARLETLADGIFAIAITLLILSIESLTLDHILRYRFSKLC
jgi:uncharacterized membrane protein